MAAAAARLLIDEGPSAVTHRRAAEAAGLAAGVGDLEDLFARCRFADCAHGREPGCAVQAALAEGELEGRRWESYLKMQREVAALERRHDAAARRAYQREWHQKVVVASRSQRAAERLSHDQPGGGRESGQGKGKRRAK